MAELLSMDSKRNNEKQKALDSALAQIERQFGKGSIMKLGADNPVQEIEATSTGSLGLDIALGIGGLPKGRIIEIYGPESSGKTTLTLHCVAEEQKKGGVCAFVDAEHALDPQYAKKLGVDLDELLISQPDTGEQALEITDTLVRSGAVSMVVVDSVAALTPKSELEGDMGDHNVGTQARLMSQAMRKLTGSISYRAFVGRLKKIFKDDFYIEIMRHNQEDEDLVNNVLVEFSKKHNIKIVATNNNFYKEKSEADAHDILLCIKEGEKLSTPVGRGRGFRYGLPNQQYSVSYTHLTLPTNREV